LGQFKKKLNYKQVNETSSGKTITKTPLYDSSESRRKLNKMNNNFFKKEKYLRAYISFPQQQ